MLKLIDIHCHLFDYASTVDLTDIDNDRQIIYVSTVLKPEEIATHVGKYIAFWFMGLHPQSVGLDDKFKRKYVDHIVDYDPIGIGEIGLDKNYPDLDKQIELLEMQLKIAKFYKLPTLYHLVGHEYEFIKIHKKWKLPKMKIMHGFNSSSEVFEELNKLGFYFSIGNRLLNNPKKREVLEAILQTKRFFLESDAPYDGGLDEVIKIAVKLKNNYEISMDEIKHILNKNFDDMVEGKFGYSEKK